jgi:hypothetical protein
MCPSLVVPVYFRCEDPNAETAGDDGPLSFECYCVNEDDKAVHQRNENRPYVSVTDAYRGESGEQEVQDGLNVDNAQGCATEPCDPLCSIMYGICSMNCYERTAPSTEIAFA